MIKVSIIIPIYNVEAYIMQCLQSVVNQTYTNIECILVDDSTPDNSMAICESFLTTYSGPIEFKIIHHKRNRGLSAARNTGTNAAQGEYIYYLDSDDEITPDCIESLVAETIKYPDVEMVVGNRRCEPGPDFDTPDCLKVEKYSTDNIWFKYNLYLHDTCLPVVAWNKLIKATFLSINEISFKNGILAEDQLWSFYVAKKIHKVATTPNVTYIYHPTPQSITLGTSYLKMANAWKKLLDEILPQMDEPLLLIQTYFFIERFLPWYQGIPRKDYHEIICNFSKALLRKHKYFLGLQLFIFFRFNLSLKLRKYESRFAAHIRKCFLIEEQRAKRKYPVLND